MTELSVVPSRRPTPDPAGPPRPAQYLEFSTSALTGVRVGTSRSWTVRAQNLHLEYVEIAASESMQRITQYEQALLVLDGTARLGVEVDGERIDVEGETFVIVPQGELRVFAGAASRVLRLVDGRDESNQEAPLNGGAYGEPDLRVAPFVPWPAPPGGPRIRAYRLRDYPPEAGRFGSIFRTSAFMVNVLDPQIGPRDPERLSPHHHDDFEQCSVAVDGDWVHHIRTPWGPDRSRWRDDEHRMVGSPSVTVIPPPLVHTSEAVGGGVNRLIDVFSPPRFDFSHHPGWVLNADDYPMPESGR